MSAFCGDTMVMPIYSSIPLIIKSMLIGMLLMVAIIFLIVIVVGLVKVYKLLADVKDCIPDSRIFPKRT
jgi:heme/copper-type cytochrome/quinol oxidase subunit 2